MVLYGSGAAANLIAIIKKGTNLQRCIVHQIRSSTRFVSWKDIKLAALRKQVKGLEKVNCFDLAVLGLEMDTDMRAQLCVRTLRGAAAAYPVLRGAIVHSDRGSQYTSGSCRGKIRGA